MDNSDKILSKNLNKRITEIQLAGDALSIKFDDNTGIKLCDDSQQCCEHRYMNTDDDLSFYTDSVFTGIEIGECLEEIKGDFEVVECQFLKVNTSKGTFTVANYNEHNGYYGGFDIIAKEL